MSIDPDDDIIDPAPKPTKPWLSRRELIGGGSLLAAGALGYGLWSRKPAETHTASGLRKVRLAWNANAICLSPALVAKELGIYERNGLDVELLNFAGSTDQLLEAISTGKAEAGVGMIMRWIKPLEQGFDVKLIGGTHGGCIRMAGSRRAGITNDPRSLRGKTVGLSEISGSGRNTFAVLLKAHGIDPNTEVEWRAYPQPLLGEAIRKGEVQAIADSDPILYLMQKQSDGDLVEVMTNLTQPWHNRVCCVLGASGDFVRSDRTSAKMLAMSLVSAAQLCDENPEKVARIFAPYAKASVEDIVWVLKSQTHDRHPVGKDLHGDIALYANELRDVGVMKANTEGRAFADRVVDDLFA